MQDKRKLNEEELEKVSGGLSNNIVYVASIFRDGIDEEEVEVEGYYENQVLAFDAACEKVQELLRYTADLKFVVKVYSYDLINRIKEEVYSETIIIDDYYKKI